MLVAVCVSQAHPSRGASQSPPQLYNTGQSWQQACTQSLSKALIKGGKTPHVLLIPPHAVFGIRAPNIFLIITSIKITAYSSLQSCNHLQQKFNLKITTKIKVVETIRGNKLSTANHCSGEEFQVLIYNSNMH